MRRQLLSLLAGLFAIVAAQAQTLRCEGNDGRVSYVNGACPPGSRAVKSLDPVPAPNTDDRKRAENRAAADARKLDSLQKQQRADEALRDKQRAAAVKRDQNLKRECLAFFQRIQQTEEYLVRGSAKAREAGQLKLQQMRQTYAAQCPG